MDIRDTEGLKVIERGEESLYHGVYFFDINKESEAPDYQYIYKKETNVEMVLDPVIGAFYDSKGHAHYSAASIKIAGYNIPSAYYQAEASYIMEGRRQAGLSKLVAKTFDIVPNPLILINTKEYSILGQYPLHEIIPRDVLEQFENWRGSTLGRFRGFASERVKAKDDDFLEDLFILSQEVRARMVMYWMVMSNKKEAFPYLDVIKGMGKQILVAHKKITDVTGVGVILDDLHEVSHTYLYFFPSVTHGINYYGFDPQCIGKVNVDPNTVFKTPIKYNKAGVKVTDLVVRSDSDGVLLRLNSCSIKSKDKLNYAFLQEKLVSSDIEVLSSKLENYVEYKNIIGLYPCGFKKEVTGGFAISGSRLSEYMVVSKDVKVEKYQCIFEYSLMKGDGSLLQDKYLEKGENNIEDILVQVKGTCLKLVDIQEIPIPICIMAGTEVNHYEDGEIIKEESYYINIQGKMAFHPVDLMPAGGFMRDGDL